eukprot:43429-Pleurochrysis_carterae.AAC.1
MGKACVAIGDLPAPCRTRAFPRGRCEVVHRRRTSRILAGRDNTPPRRPAVRPAGRRPRSPSGACACQCQLRWRPGHVGKWAA